MADDSISPRQMKLLSHPAPMLLRPPAIVDGWCSLEEHQRAHALEVLEKYEDAVALWYRAIGLMLDGFNSQWRLSAEEPIQEATIKRIHLLGLELSSAKAALDLTMSGYYSIAMAAIRHMLEAAAQGMYLLLFPDQHLAWDQENEAPGMRKMIDQIKKALREANDGDLHPEQFERLYVSWKLMCKGAHPSGDGLMQVIAQDDDPRNMVGPVFRKGFVDVIFDHGIWALMMTLTVFPSVAMMDESWEQRFRAWMDDRQVWRDGFRLALGEPDANDSVGSRDIQF